MNIDQFLKKTDFKLLKIQKELILEGEYDKGSYKSAIEGIINFLDEFQDMASNYIGEDKVFK